MRLVQTWIFISARSATHEGTYRSLLWTRTPKGILSLPASCKQVAREYASSIAMTAPLPELGRKGWHESPACTTRPLGECHSGCGSRHISLQSMHSLLVVDLTSSLRYSAHPSSSGMNFKALDAFVVADHDSRELRSMSLWVRSQDMVFRESFLAMTMWTSGPMMTLKCSTLSFQC